jgi:hypothetical protein
VGYGLACDLDAGTCRRDHIASRLEKVEADGGDYEARCPACGHGGFRVSRPTRSKRLRNVWTCACQRCRGRCGPGAIRVALLRLGISAACLGTYDGDNAKEIPADVARAMDLVISDILATPGLKLQDVRLALAEAQGRKIPDDDYTEFVKFAKGVGLAHQQAYEAARRWVRRPSDCPPQTGGEVVDTSRNTEQGNPVKPRRSQPRGPTEKVETPSRKSRAADDRPTEKVEQTQDDTKNRGHAP